MDKRIFSCFAFYLLFGGLVLSVVDPQGLVVWYRGKVLKIWKTKLSESEADLKEKIDK